MLIWRCKKERVTLATCNRCGCSTVAWLKSNRTGNSYLVNAEAEQVRLGKPAKYGWAFRNGFHVCSDYLRYKTLSEDSAAREQARLEKIPETLDPALLSQEMFTVHTDNMSSWPIYQLYLKMPKWTYSVQLWSDTVKDGFQATIEKYLSGN